MIKKFIVLMTPSLVRCFKPLIMTLPDAAVVAYYTGKFLNKIVPEIFIFDGCYFLVSSKRFYLSKLIVPCYIISVIIM